MRGLSVFNVRHPEYYYTLYTTLRTVSVQHVFPPQELNAVDVCMVDYMLYTTLRTHKCAIGILYWEDSARLQNRRRISWSQSASRSAGV